MKCPFVIRVCTVCKRLLVANLQNFNKMKNGKYGLRAECKECGKSKNCNWYEDNKEKRKRTKKKYYNKNKEKILEYSKQYYKENPHIAFNSSIRRRNKIEGNGEISKYQWLEMMEFFDWKCAYSGVSLNKNNRSIDHIIPLDKGGVNIIWNCIPMERTYNSSKYTSDFLEWYIQQSFYSEERLNKIYEWQEYAFEKWGSNK